MDSAHRIRAAKKILELAGELTITNDFKPTPSSRWPTYDQVLADIQHPERKWQYDIRAYGDNKLWVTVALGIGPSYYFLGNLDSDQPITIDTKRAAFESTPEFREAVRKAKLEYDRRIFQYFDQHPSQDDKA